MGATTQLVERGNFSVLIVDDEDAMREQLRMRFELEGFKVFDADGGDSGFRVCQKMHPDLVITDIRMAQGTGTELLKRLSSESGEAMPVVMCITGHSDLQIHEAYSYGAYAVFQKPFDIKDVISASRRFLDLRKKQQEASEALKNFDRDLRQVLGVVKRGHMPDDKALTMADLRQVISMIVHEVNSPLSVISMNAALLISTLAQGAARLEAAQRMAGAIDQNCQRLIEISQTLRDLFSAQAQVEPLKVDLAQVVQEAVAAMDERAALAGLDVRVSGGETIVDGVKRQLVQLVRNLLENAAHASREAGQKRIDVELVRSGGLVTLSVSDRGNGVPDEIRAEIFDPFFSTKGKDGTGMGLVICKKVAEAHGGTVTLAPSKVGAKFVLTLKAGS